MGRNAAPDQVALRARASGWARYIRAKNRYSSVSAMAKDMDYNQGSLNAIINGKGTVGLEFVIKLALVGQESLDTVCLRDPPEAFMRPAGATSGAAPSLAHEPSPAYAPRPLRKSRRASGVAPTR